MFPKMANAVVMAGSMPRLSVTVKHRPGLKRPSRFRVRGFLDVVAEDRWSLALWGFHVMRRTTAVLAFSAALATIAGAFTLLPETSIADARPAAATATFEVATNDGYGVGECLALGGECARSVADAWCQSQGFGRAESYRASVETTGSVILASTAQQPRAVAVTCAR